MNKRMVLLFISASVMLGCKTTKPTSRDIMPSPNVIGNGIVDPFQDYGEWGSLADQDVLFATTRLPAPAETALPFTNGRDTLLHLGAMEVVIEGDRSWDTLEPGHSENATEILTLTTGEYRSYGPLDDALYVLTDYSRLPEDPAEPGRMYAEEINRRLESNPVKDLFIYIHGVNTTFDDPILVAAEFWYYTGYRGVPIAFSWPSSQNILEYVPDVDSAEYSATFFRQFIQYLKDETVAENIHIIAYSAGTKLVSQVLHELGLIEQASPSEGGTRIGRVYFVAGDVERGLFSVYASDSLLESLENLTIYMSATDQALKMSESIRSQPRLGQTWGEDIDREMLRRFYSLNKIDVVDVTGLDGSRAYYGHRYFQASPMVSSDLLASLGLGLSPEHRGLELNQELLYWEFSDNYTIRLQQAIWETKLPQ